MAASKINHTVIATACSVSEYTMVEIPHTIIISIEKKRSPIPFIGCTGPCIIPTNGMVIDRSEINLAPIVPLGYKGSLNIEMIRCARFNDNSWVKGQGIRTIKC